MDNRPIVIIGAGPAGLMAAQELALRGFKVQVYEQNKAAARKFLVAGHGGFNLTHSEAIADFVTRYDAQQIRDIVRFFDNQATVAWLARIGIPTYTGSSGKIFPAKSIKPIQVLQAWLAYLQEIGVNIHYQHRLVDFDEKEVHLVQAGENTKRIAYRQLILGLGGGSWRKTGSDASWIPLMESKGIQVNPLESANSGYNTIMSWPELEGKLLKNISVRFENNRKMGEIVFTNYGIEGSPLYYMNRFTRASCFPITLYLDLKPALTEGDIYNKLKSSNKVTIALKDKLRFSATAIAMLKKLDKHTFTNPHELAKAIKSYPIAVESLRPLDEVISTAGGVLFSELNDRLALKRYPRVYCVGEMLDWEAPTGGYLLQACFSTGYWVAQKID